jgi:hypothetical protein
VVLKTGLGEAAGAFPRELSVSDIPINCGSVNDPPASPESEMSLGTTGAGLNHPVPDQQ